MLARAVSLIIVSQLAWLAPAHAAEPVLAVLYVDNHTGDADYDVLEKGLADMLVTDLAAQGLTVVERARLQALIDEQKLQGTKFFDPKTAVKVGKGLGATHVVMGAMAAMQPILRLDLRLIDVATGAVVVTAKVDGPSATLFELEQQLVERFMQGFERRFAASPTPQTKVRDVQALLEYSRGIDLADKGELEAAQKKIEQTIKLSPSFGLARTRKDEIVKRLQGSRDRRDTLLEDYRAKLTRDLADAQARYDQITPLARVGWRHIEQQLIASSVPALVTDDSIAIAKLGQEKALKAAMVAWTESMLHYASELDAAIETKRVLWSSDFLSSDNIKLLKALELEPDLQTTPTEVRRKIAEFLLMGRLEVGDSERVIIAPPLANLDKQWDARAWKLLAEADELSKRETTDYYQTGTLVTWGEALILRNRTDEAIAKWQEILDRYPSSPNFDRHERRIKEVLGLVSNHTARELASWSEGLTTCQDMKLRVAFDTIQSRRFRMLGLDAIPAIEAEVSKACRDNPAAKSFWNYLYSRFALVYGKGGRCAEFEIWMTKFVANGGSKGEVAAWRKNWTKCPLP